MTIGSDFHAVLAAARDGAEWALARLYTDLQPNVLRYLMVHEPAAAEDLASEVWIGVARGLGRFSGGEDAFRAWVFTIARRRVADLHRKMARQPVVPVPPRELASLGTVGNVEDDAIATLPDDVMSRLATLSPDQAEVLLLRVVADLSVSETANILGKRPGAVRILQHRALRRLAQESFDGSETE